VPEVVTVSGELEESTNGLDLVVFSSTRVPAIAVKGDVGTAIVEAVGL
jgi:hypothetical protein